MNPENAKSSEPTVSFPWKPVLIRCALFIGGGVAGLVLATLVVVLLSISIGEGTVQGGPMISLLFTLIPIAGMTGGVLLTGWFERLKKSGPFPGEPAAIAAAQKILLIAIILQLLAGLIRSGLYLPIYGSLGAIGVFLVTHALGMSRGGQIVWLIVTGLLGLVRWSAGFLGKPNVDQAAVFFLGILGLLVSLIAMLLLNKRATTALEKAGLKVGFTGVPLRQFPSLASTGETHEATALTNSDSPSPVQPETEPSLALEPTAEFYYLGPNNEPIGPITSDVLLQFRESGVVTDDTLVAPEGESEWNPLRSFLEITEEAQP